MKNILLHLWQLPQNILAIIILLFLKEKSSLIYKGIKFHICPRFRGGISLGNHAIVRTYPHDTYTWNTVKHEWGHTRQSLKYGWLYLIIIGIPSFLGACVCSLFHKSADWYYSQPWEASADKYGGVER